MKFSFKKRIAIFNTSAVAVITALVFLVIYAVVYVTSFIHLDQDIILEKEEIINNLDWKDDLIIINKMPEWEEAEHKKVEINPTFIQIVDHNGKLIFKSANLKKQYFLFNPSNKKESYLNTLLEGQRLRLGQFSIQNDDGKVIGQLTIGVSQEESHYVLDNLLFTLCIAFPVLLFILYLVIYLTVSKAIAPVHRLIHAAAGIKDSTIEALLPLPENEDEIYQLAKTINELLSRIGNSIQQQKQFTADASHEIRTPLTAIRGTLEVLIRKKRESGQYEEKIRDVIEQTDKLNFLLDQLLQLARLESSPVNRAAVNLPNLVKETLQKWDKQITERGIRVELNIEAITTVFSDHFFLLMMIDNLITNAIKYSAINGKIACLWNEKEKTLSIINDGPGIRKEQIPFLYDRFFRTDQSRSSELPGNGLGLAIVKKLADLQQIEISVQSDPGCTIFSLKFIA